MMKISDIGINLIKQFEGCRLFVYQGEYDRTGLLTCGYGHTGDEVQKLGLGTPITQELADIYLMQDIAKAEKVVNKYQKNYNFNQYQYDALVSFAFNIGNIDQLTNNGKRSIAEISNKIPEYCKANGVRVDGLYRRRVEEKALFDTPVLNGWVSATKWAYFDNGTQYKNQWIKYKDEWYYFNADGIMATNQFVDWKGITYYLKDDGIMAHDEVLNIGGRNLTFDSEGKIK